MAEKWLTVLFSLCLFCQCESLGLFEDFLGSPGPCIELCENTYPQHTYDKSQHLGYCQRGCRLFTIIDFLSDGQDLNKTKDSCTYSCQDAYEEKDDAAACLVGCEGQINIIKKKRDHYKQMELDQSPVSAVYPLFYVHSLYSNMVDKLSQHMSVSWSFYMQAENGRLVVVKSEPRYYTRTEYSILPDDDDYKTSNYMETNLASVDNSATPNLKHSQVHAFREREFEGVNVAVQQEPVTDWLACISKKTGLPRLLLSFTIFMSAMMMIWLCFTTAATAPEHRIQTQKLSINGDVEYASATQMKEMLYKIHPQDQFQAAPLPIKIQVQQI